jgi:hypothetical protein
MKQDNFGFRAQRRVDDESANIDAAIVVFCLCLAAAWVLGGFL